MTEIQKSPYYNIVKKLSEQHKLYHPNYMYHYRPRKRSVFCWVEVSERKADGYRAQGEDRGKHPSKCGK